MRGVKIHFTVYLTILVLGYYGALREYLSFMGFIIVHEFCHLLFAYATGGRVGAITILPIGTMLDVDIYGRKSQIIVALCAPLLSILLGVVFLRLGLSFYCEINFAIAFVNLIPALPLDGGRAVCAIVGKRMCTVLTRLVGYILIICGFMLLNATLHGVWFLITGLTILYQKL